MNNCISGQQVSENNSRYWTGDGDSKPGIKMFHEWGETARSTEKCEEGKYVIIKISPQSHSFETDSVCNFC